MRVAVGIFVAVTRYGAVTGVGVTVDWGISPDSRVKAITVGSRSAGIKVGKGTWPRLLQAPKTMAMPRTITIPRICFRILLLKVINMSKFIPQVTYIGRRIDLRPSDPLQQLLWEVLGTMFMNFLA